MSTPLPSLGAVDEPVRVQALDLAWPAGMSRSSAYDACSWALQAVLSVIGLVLFSPLFVVIAIAVRLSSPGPIFYTGERIGRHGRPFRIRKFRTMMPGTEGRIGGRLLSEADKDAYCTKLGRILKKSKLDELPQLLNVIGGSMRLVGPRPVRPVFLARFAAEIPRYAARFAVPPGITGIAQLRGGYYTSARNKLRYDLIYIHRRSLALDVQIILLTFVKMLNRWLGMGVLVLFLFLFASFIPPRLHPVFSVSVFGLRLSLVYLLILFVAIWTVVKRGSHSFSLYRCPLNVAIPLFSAVAVAAAVLSTEPSRALQGAGYYVVTGLLLSFIIVNSLSNREFFTLTVRVVALTSVAISLLGLVQVFLVNYGGAPSIAADGARLTDGPARLASIVGGPMVLAVYLVLGIPILLAEVMAAETQRSRDFWLVCSTISFVGIFFTQTRMGLVALLVTGSIFLYRRRPYALAFCGMFVAGLALLAAAGSPRFSPTGIANEVTRWAEQNSAEFLAVPPTRWLIGDAAEVPGLLFASKRETRAADARGRDDEEIPNMHVTLVLEHGVAGWLILMWVIVAALRAMKRAHDQMRDERLKRTLWAIISALAGFLVSMNGMNTFHNLAVQIFFWSLLGIGLGIVVHQSGPRWSNMIWRFGDAGD